MSILKRLVEVGSYQYGSTRLQGGRTAPYSVRFPTAADDAFIDFLADRAVEILPWRDWPTPFIFGIADSGIPLARAVWRGLKRVVDDAKLTIISSRDERFSLDPSSSGETSIIVDNAITTGTTLRWAHQRLVAACHSPEVAIRFFDREEVEANGQSLIDPIQRELGIAIISMFRIQDLLPVLPEEERQTILTHLVHSGTPDVRAHVEATYVFKNGSWSSR